MKNDGVVLFAGAQGTPPPEVFEEARRNNPIWYQVLEKAYEEFAKRPENREIYADPTGEGATLEQIRLVFTFMGVEPWCLLARPYPPERLERIPRHVVLEPDRLVAALKEIQAAAGSIAAEVAFHDGSRGHCITVKSYDAGADRFTYHDPWPGESLLCRANNSAGVDAVAQGKLWTITADELERVVFAAYVLPNMWARKQHAQCDVPFDQVTQGEFFGHFCLRQLEERAEQGVHRHWFAPTAFKDEVSLVVERLNDGKVVRALLTIDRAWMSKNMLLALDLVKSFIPAFSPPPDIDTYHHLSKTLWKMKRGGFPNDPGDSPVAGCIHAFLGNVREATLNTDLGMLTLRNVASDDKQIHELEFCLF